MRATTCWTPKVSRATRALMMLELSPLLTAAKAPAESMPASSSVWRSKPRPVTWRPVKSGPSRRMASGSWSITATLWPMSSSRRAIAEPTRPQPITTTCTGDSQDHECGAPGPEPGACPAAKLHLSRGGAAVRSAATHPPDGGGRGPGVRTIAAVPTLSDLGQLPKRLVLGRPVRSDRLGESLLPKRLALPIFASDPLSSVAYAPQEILIVLTLAGTAFLYLAPWLAIAVVLLLVTVVLSYRQVVRAYPSGGGDYEVAMKNHGQLAGLTVASALLVDYVLTVAVSVAAGTDNIISAFPDLNQYRVPIAVGLVTLLAGPGLVRELVAAGVTAESAAYSITPEPGYGQLTGLALLFFVFRAFASG